MKVEKVDISGKQNKIQLDQRNFNKEPWQGYAENLESPKFTVSRFLHFSHFAPGALFRDRATLHELKLNVKQLLGMARCINLAMKLTEDYALFQLKNNWGPYHIPQYFPAKPDKCVGRSFIRKGNPESLPDATVLLLVENRYSAQVASEVAHSSCSLRGSVFHLLSGRDAAH